MSTELGSVLRRTIEKRNMSRKELSIKTGLSESALSRLISGDRGAKVSLDVMNRLAAALDIPLLYFVQRSGFSFQPESLLSLVDAEEIIGKLIRPTLDRIAQDEEYLHHLFEAVQLSLEPAVARERLFSMTATDQLKLLVANGFDISVVDDSDPSGCVEFRSMPPLKHQLPSPMIRSLAEDSGEKHHPSVHVPIKSDQFAHVRLMEGSVFKGDAPKLQNVIANIDKMDPEIAEKLLWQIETTAELFPKKPATKIIDNNP